MADVIMLAERPSNVSARSVPAAPSAASFADSAVSDAAPQAIGNYKGVMLCNRPGVIADTPDWLKPAGNELPVFRAGVPHEVVHPRGRDTLFDRPPVKIPPRKKRHDAMEAHRSWLTSLIQRRAALQVRACAGALAHRACGWVRCPGNRAIPDVQAERDSEELRKTEVHKHVAERQQAFRDLVRSQASTTHSLALPQSVYHMCLPPCPVCAGPIRRHGVSCNGRCSSCFRGSVRR